jgi:hypothetical protein
MMDRPVREGSDFLLAVFCGGLAWLTVKKCLQRPLPPQR